MNDGRLNENINRSFIDCLVLEKEKEKMSFQMNS